MNECGWVKADPMSRWKAKPVRDTLRVQAGDRVRCIVLDGEVRILSPSPGTR